MTADQDESDTVPVSVRLGEVVPPEDPEDWTRPLTWVVAAGLLVPAVITAAWLWLANPSSPSGLAALVLVVAALVGGGGGLAGGTQRSSARAFGGTVAAALFAGLTVVIVTAGRPEGVPAHALLGVAAGLIGAGATGIVLGGLQRRRRRETLLRVGLVVGAAAGLIAAALVLASS